MSYELIGLLGSSFIVLSMSFTSTSNKRNILMRVLNGVGSICFIVYGLLIPAYSTALVNTITLVVNIVHIYKLRKGCVNACKQGEEL